MVLCADVRSTESTVATSSPSVTQYADTHAADKQVRHGINLVSWSVSRDICSPAAPRPTIRPPKQARHYLRPSRSQLFLLRYTTLQHHQQPPLPPPPPTACKRTGSSGVVVRMTSLACDCCRRDRRPITRGGGMRVVVVTMAGGGRSRRRRAPLSCARTSAARCVPVAATHAGVCKPTAVVELWGRRRRGRVPKQRCVPGIH